MHSEAWNWIARYATDEPIQVLDIGGRDINGSPRELFPNATYIVLDIKADEHVDIVADAATWNPQGQRWDTVIAAEVFEHAPDWQAICVTAWQALRPGGIFLVTTAALGRPAHSAIDGQELRNGEHYGNVDPDDLREVLDRIGFRVIVVDHQPSTCDVRALAVKGG